MRRELMSNQAEAGADSGPGPSDGSANSEGLSQANPPLHPTQLEKQDKDAMAQTGIVGIDDSTRTVQIVAGSRIFGTTDPHAINVLLEQVLAVTPKNGEYSLENLKWSVATAPGHRSKKCTRRAPCRANDRGSQFGDGMSQTRFN